MMLCLHVVRYSTTTTGKDWSLIWKHNPVPFCHPPLPGPAPMAVILTDTMNRGYLQPIDSKWFWSIQDYPGCLEICCIIEVELACKSSPYLSQDKSIHECCFYFSQQEKNRAMLVTKSSMHCQHRTTLLYTKYDMVEIISNQNKCR